MSWVTQEGRIATLQYHWAVIQCDGKHAECCYAGQQAQGGAIERNKRAKQRMLQINIAVGAREQKHAERQRHQRERSQTGILATFA